MTLENFLGHVRRSHTAVAGGPGADAPKRTGLFGIGLVGRGLTRVYVRTHTTTTK